MREDVLKKMIEVELPTTKEFSRIVETLTRIGMKTQENKLYQSCHIMHLKGKYYICHFKELFALDGKKSTMTKKDYFRRDRIIYRLHFWGMIKEILTPENMSENVHKKLPLFVLPYGEKKGWELIPKYSMSKNFSGPKEPLNLER